MNICTYAADGADAVLQVGSGAAEISIYIRPHAYDFLEDMKEKYELIIYSSLGHGYHQTVIDYLERQKKYFMHKFGEEYCLFANISYGIKCINFLLENRSLEDIVIVDTSVKAFPLSPDNVVPISAYDGNINNPDNELVKVAVILDKLAKEKNIRSALKSYREDS